MFGLRLVMVIWISKQWVKIYKNTNTIIFIISRKRRTYRWMRNSLTDNNIFSKNIQKVKDGIVYQLTSSDFELLEIFAKLYQGIEKWLKISKVDELETVKLQLIEFIKTNDKIPSNWKEEVLKELENWIIKILVNR